MSGGRAIVATAAFSRPRRTRPVQQSGTHNTVEASHESISQEKGNIKSRKEQNKAHTAVPQGPKTKNQKSQRHQPPKSDAQRGKEAGKLDKKRKREEVDPQDTEEQTAKRRRESPGNEGNYDDFDSDHSSESSELSDICDLTALENELLALHVLKKEELGEAPNANTAQKAVNKRPRKIASNDSGSAGRKKQNPRSKDTKAYGTRVTKASTVTRSQSRVTTKGLEGALAKENPAAAKGKSADAKSLRLGKPTTKERKTVIVRKLKPMTEEMLARSDQHGRKLSARRLGIFRGAIRAIKVEAETI